MVAIGLMVRVAIGLPLVVTVADSPLRPGAWEITNELTQSSINGNAPLGHRARPARRCLLPADAARGPGLAFIQDDCVSTGQSLGDGHYRYSLQCPTGSGNGTITTDVSGTFSAEGYDGVAVSTQKEAGMVVTMHSHIVAHRVGECATMG